VNSAANPVSLRQTADRQTATTSAANRPQTKMAPGSERQAVSTNKSRAEKTSQSKIQSESQIPYSEAKAS